MTEPSTDDDNDGKNENYNGDSGKGACQKKNTGFFGSFSQMSDPHPHTPIWEASVQKKIWGFILRFRP